MSARSKNFRVSAANWDLLLKTKPDGLSITEYGNMVISYSFKQAEVELAYTSQSYNPKLTTK